MPKMKTTHLKTNEFTPTPAEIARVAVMATEDVAQGGQPFVTAIRHPHGEDGAAQDAIWIIDILIVSTQDTISITSRDPDSLKSAATLGAAIAYSYLVMLGLLDPDDLPDDITIP